MTIRNFGTVHNFEEKKEGSTVLVLILVFVLGLMLTFTRSEYLILDIGSDIVSGFMLTFTWSDIRY